MDSRGKRPNPEMALRVAARSRSALSTERIAERACAVMQKMRGAEGVFGLEPGVAGKAARGEATSGLARALAALAWPRGNSGVKARVVASLGLLGASKGLSVASPLCFKHAVDGLAGAATATVASPMSLLTLYGAMRAGSSLAQEARGATFARVSQRAGREAARAAFSHALRLDAGYHSMEQTGVLQRAIDRGSRGVQGALSAALLSVFPTALEGALVAGMLAARTTWPIAGVAAGTVAVYGAYTVGVTRWRTRFRGEMNAREGECAGVVSEALANHEAVKAFAGERLETERYDDKLKSYEGAAVKTQQSLAILNFGQAAIFSSSLALCLLMCANGVRDGSLSVGDVAMVNGLLFQLSVPLSFLGTAYREARQSLVDMSHMLRLMEARTSVLERADPLPLPPGAPSIDFADVAFSYPGMSRDQRVLDRFNIRVPCGSSLALVGPSGGGKSTVGKLLLRFHDPNEGSVAIGGVDARDLDLQELRNAMAVVPQDAALFNDTLFNNIAYAQEGATREEVEEAAHQAALDDVVRKLPEGFETKLGERGSRLSGGERQRVAIARACLRQPRLLLCDEATSALDSHTEADVMSSLAQLSRGPTAVFIAHRLATARMCDAIAVVSHGRVEEFGTHEDLLRLDGTYASIWRQQQASDDLRSSDARTLSSSAAAASA